jgi:PAS domain S-box-containing protein
MDLKIDLGAKKNLKAPSLSPKTVLLYAILTILIINFAVFLNQWFHAEEIKLDIFIIPSIVGAIFGLIFSFLRLTVERKIAQVRSFWEEMFQSTINGIILTDLTGKIKYANDYALNYHEYTLEELKEFYIFDLVTPEFIEIIREYLKDIIERKETEALEIGFLTKSGKVKYAELSGKLVRYGANELIQFVEIDTTEKRRFESELIEAEKKYRELFENAVIGAYRTTPDGKIIDVNPAFVKMFGAKDKFEILQMKASDLLR